MKVLSREAVPKSFEHKITQVICDRCDNDIKEGEKYYTVETSIYDGEQTNLETNHYCQYCISEAVATTVQKLDFLDDMNVECNKFYENGTTSVSKVNEEYELFFTRGITFEK